MARVVETSDVVKRLQDEGWRLVEQGRRSLRFENAAVEQVTLPRHPRRPDAVFLADLRYRLPNARFDFATIAVDEPLEQIAGFRILIDQAEAADRDVATLLKTLGELNCALGGSGLELEALRIESHQQPAGEAPPPRVRCFRARPTVDEVADREVIRTAWRQTIAVLAERTLSTIERERRVILRKLLDVMDPLPQIGRPLEALEAAEEAIVSRRGTLRYPSAAFMRELDPGNVRDRPRSAVTRKHAYRDLTDADRLPTLSASVIRIVDAAGGILSRSAEVEELVRAVEQDPAVAARLISRATRADIPIRPEKKKQMTAAQAARLLGAQKVRVIALGSELVSRYSKGHCDAFDYPTFWQECTARAAAAKVLTIASGRKDVSPEEAYTAGLLCQVGRLALATAYPKAYGALLDQAAGRADRLLRMEFEKFKLDHNELAAEMMASWRMPDLREAVLYQDDPETLPKKERFMAQTLQWTGLAWDLLENGGEQIDQAAVDRAVTGAAELGVGSWGFAAEFVKIHDTWGQEAGPLNVAPIAWQAGALAVD